MALTMPDLDRLKSQLLTTGLQQKDFPLYQVIDQLIAALRQTINVVDDALPSSGGGGSAFGQSFATIANEKATLPSSRRLVAGPGISFNDNFNNLIISGAPIPGSDGIEGDEGPMGVPGIQGPVGPAGPSGGGSAMPYWFTDNEEAPEYPALMTLFNANMIPETAIIDGTLLARNAANETITGIWTFTASRVVMQRNGTVTLRVIDDSAPLDEKRWDLINNAGDLILRAVDDAAAVNRTILEWVRTGTDAILNIHTGFSLVSFGDMALGADQTALDIGNLAIITINPSAAFSIRGILAKTAGRVVVIKSIAGAGFAFTITHEDGAAAAADRIQCPFAANFAMNNGYSAILYYDTNRSRWQFIAKAT